MNPVHGGTQKKGSSLSQTSQALITQLEKDLSYVRRTNFTTPDNRNWLIKSLNTISRGLMSGQKNAQDSALLFHSVLTSYRDFNADYSVISKALQTGIKHLPKLSNPVAQQALSTATSRLNAAFAKFEQNTIKFLKNPSVKTERYLNTRSAVWQSCLSEGRKALTTLYWSVSFEKIANQALTSPTSRQALRIIENLVRMEQRYGKQKAEKVSILKRFTNFISNTFTRLKKALKTYNPLKHIDKFANLFFTKTPALTALGLATWLNETGSKKLLQQAYRVSWSEVAENPGTIPRNQFDSLISAALAENRELIKRYQSHFFTVDPKNPRKRTNPLFGSSALTTLKKDRTRIISLLYKAKTTSDQKRKLEYLKKASKLNAFAEKKFAILCARAVEQKVIEPKKPKKWYEKAFNWVKKNTNKILGGVAVVGGVVAAIGTLGLASPLVLVATKYTTNAVKAALKLIENYKKYNKITAKGVFKAVMEMVPEPAKIAFSLIKSSRYGSRIFKLLSQIKRLSKLRNNYSIDSKSYKLTEGLLSKIKQNPTSLDSMDLGLLFTALGSSAHLSAFVPSQQLSSSAARAARELFYQRARITPPIKLQSLIPRQR